MKDDLFIKAVAKMILADEKIHPAEMSFFKNLSLEKDLDQAGIEKILEDAKATTLDELGEGLQTYEDRLFVVQQVYYVAQCDEDYALSEMKLFDEMVKLFGIKKEDVERVERSAKTLSEGRYDLFFDPDIAYLHNNFMQSSFFAHQE